MSESARPRVVLSYGLGVDSTAVLLRWIFEPQARPCELSELLVVTAMTGDEWPQTGDLVERHVLPLLRAHSVRYAQVARAGASQAEGIAVLDDSRRPRRLHLGGAYRLRDEMQAAGTVAPLPADSYSSKTDTIPRWQSTTPVHTRDRAARRTNLART